MLDVSDITIQNFSVEHGCQIFLLREDLLPLACGGNKVRIATKLLEDARNKGATCIVGYGNSRSNLCRALAMLSAREGLKCVIVSPKDDDGSRVQTTNSRILDLYGCETHICEKGKNISFVIEKCISGLREAGETPYYIFGNKYGNGNESVLMSAYVSVAEKIQQYEQKNNLFFDRIVLPVGTGSTYTGLLCGFRAAGKSTKITGISIAREKKKCLDVLSSFISAYRKRNPGLPDTLDEQILDQYLMGGYGKTTPELLSFLHCLLRKNAVFMDATYVGKAYWGLIQLLKEDHVRNEKILFIHTGSLPLAFDTLLNQE